MTPIVAKHGYGEDAAIEQPAIQVFGALGWETVNLYHEGVGGTSTEGRDSEKQVALGGVASCGVATSQPRVGVHHHRSSDREGHLSISPQAV